MTICGFTGGYEHSWLLYWLLDNFTLTTKPQELVQHITHKLQVQYLPMTKMSA